MKRRQFLKRIPLASAPFMLGGYPVHLFGGTSGTHKLSMDNDNVMVIIQLHGGNDSLNSFIPIDRYAEYYNLRPNIAIPESGIRKFIPLDNTLSREAQIGLHPDIQGIKEMYDQGKVALVQNVSYENNNGSHFRGRDIWFLGVDFDDYTTGSGWMGRYLDNQFPGYPDGPPEAYPNDTMPDPLGLEIGTGVSLAFHRDNGIPAGLAVQNPQAFYDLINSVGGDAPLVDDNSHYGEELRYILGIEAQSNRYASRLKQVYEAGTNSPVVYPETYPLSAPDSSLRNRLAGQLRLIARLLHGGIKTRLFLVRIGGFDTHAQQVESYDATMGGHAALLYHISSAVNAFYKDLKRLGQEDRVLSLTVSEFGRRAKSNGSYGTDHGKAGTMMVFGKAVKGGVYQKESVLDNLSRDNLAMQYDYRQVLTNILEDWLGAEPDAVADAKFDSFSATKLDLIGTITEAEKPFVIDRFRLEDCFPNPASERTTIGYYINNNTYVNLRISDLSGKTVSVLVDGEKNWGKHEVQVDVTNFKTGQYIYTMEAAGFVFSKKLVVL